MSGHIASKSTYYTIFATLMVLLIATVAVAYVHLGAFNIVVAMTIAVTKALLVILYFMHVRWSSRLVWIFAGAGFFWLGILFVLTTSDYIARTWLGVPLGWE